MIDKLVSDDLLALGRDTAACVPPLEAMLPADAPVAPMQLLRLASAYSHRAARAAFGATVLATVAAGIACAWVWPRPFDGSVWDQILYRVNGTCFAVFVLAIAMVVALSARRRAEARFARVVAVAADHAEVGNRLVARLDTAALAVGLAGSTLYVASVVTIFGELEGDLFRNPYDWITAAEWVRPLYGDRLRDLFILVPVLAVAGAVVARNVDRLRWLARPGVMWAAIAVALIAVRVTFRLGAELNGWEVDDPIPSSGIRTAVTAISTLAVFVAVASYVLRRRTREVG